MMVAINTFLNVPKFVVSQANVRHVGFTESHLNVIATVVKPMSKTIQPHLVDPFPSSCHCIMSNEWNQ